MNHKPEGERLALEIMYYRHRFDNGINAYFAMLEQRMEERDLKKKAELTVRMIDISKENRLLDYWLQRRLREKNKRKFDKYEHRTHPTTQTPYP